MLISQVFTNRIHPDILNLPPPHNPKNSWLTLSINISSAESCKLAVEPLPMTLCLRKHTLMCIKGNYMEGKSFTNTK